MKLVILDIEGTIITEYDYSYPEDDNERFRAKIDQSLGETLGNLVGLGCKIVIATGTDGDNLQYYESQFKRYGVHQHITAYQPRSHAPMQSKKDKVEAYFSEEKEIQEKENVYFFDDALNNVKSVQSAGFINAFQVTTQLPLANQLLELVNQLQLEPTESNATLFRSERKAGSQSVLATRGYNQEDQDKPCCAMM